MILSGELSPRDDEESKAVPGKPPLGPIPSRGNIRGIDTSVPNPARVYDYLLGGKDNFEADRMTAQAGSHWHHPHAHGSRAGRQLPGDMPPHR